MACIVNDIKLASDGTPYFPPLTHKQRDILRRRSVMVEISYDPERDSSPVEWLATILNSALAKVDPDMYVAGTRGSVGDDWPLETRYRRNGTIFAWQS